MRALTLFFYGFASLCLGVIALSSAALGFSSVLAAAIGGPGDLPLVVIRTIALLTTFSTILFFGLAIGAAANGAADSLGGGDGPLTGGRLYHRGGDEDEWDAARGRFRTPPGGHHH